MTPSFLPSGGPSLRDLGPSEKEGRSGPRRRRGRRGTYLGLQGVPRFLDEVGLDGEEEQERESRVPTERGGKVGVRGLPTPSPNDWWEEVRTGCRV